VSGKVRGQGEIRSVAEMSERSGEGSGEVMSGDFRGHEK
jgi:hypothetical protein